MIDERLIERLAGAIGQAAARVALLEGKPEVFYWQGVKAGLEAALREARSLLIVPRSKSLKQSVELDEGNPAQNDTTNDPKVIRNAVILPARNPNMPNVPRPTVGYSKPVVKPCGDDSSES
ncbi:MAG: hypothetical protein IAE83_06660 [Anaerolinea sp.]|nr:hypothetical protein [Anaerolinea sp.]MCC6974302.1 hypothetical protein [Anaerolineae bacterium]CAG0973126.1 hypothetical protein ANRL4_01396 [Anaerolineae bacterium]